MWYKITILIYHLVIIFEDIVATAVIDVAVRILVGQFAFIQREGTRTNLHIVDGNGEMQLFVFRKIGVNGIVRLLLLERREIGRFVELVGLGEIMVPLPDSGRGTTYTIVHRSGRFLQFQGRQLQINRCHGFILCIVHRIVF